MTILITADLHLSENPRDRYRLDWQSDLRRMVKQHDVELVIICGDLTEEKDRHGAWLVNQVVNSLAKLAELCPVIIIRGNHDYVDLSTPFYAFLGRIPGIHWVGTPETTKTLPYPPLQGLGRVLLLPHGGDTPGGRFDWVFTHQTFQGARTGPGVQMRGLPVDTFGKARVISGDIHVPQKIGHLIEYVGAPYLIDFGDRYDPRVLLLEQGKVRSIPCKGPQKRLVEITTLSELEKGTTNTRYINPGDILKVRMLIGPEQKASWSELRDKIRAWGEEHGYLVHQVQPVMLETIRRQKKHKVRQAKTDADIFAAYVKHRGVDKLTAKAGMKILRKV